MEKKQDISKEAMIDLISGVTERIASGYDPEQLTQLDGEQFLALRLCLIYVRDWADGMLSNVGLPKNFEKSWVGTVGGIPCTKMCSGEGATEPNKAILIQVQKLRGLSADTIMRDTKK